MTQQQPLNELRVLAGSNFDSSSWPSLYELLQTTFVSASQLQDPAAAQQFRSALAEIDQKLRTNATEQDKRWRQVMALLGRVRGVVALAAANADEAHAMMSDALEQYRAIGFGPGIAVVALDLESLHWRAQDVPAAVEYLLQAADAIKPPQAEPVQANLQKAINDELLRAAVNLYYNFNDAPAAIRVARRAVEFVPNEQAGWQVLANAYAREQKFDEAIEAYQHLVLLDPGEKSSARANLAAALSQVNREGEALAAVEESLRIRPGRVRPLSLRGQLRERAGDIDGAVADLEETIRLLEADRPVDDEQDPAARQAYREHWTMWMTAYHHLVEIHKQRKDSAALQAVIARLKQTGDDALSAMGYQIAGDLARDNGRFDEAAREYDQAIAAFPSGSEARQARAALAIETGDVDGVIAQLSRLASRHEAPAEAIAGLQQAAKKFPDERRIQRWLGFAYFEQGDFASAESNLDAYLAGHGQDGEATRWLGVSLISIDPQDYQPKRDGPRCFRGLEVLAQAASLGDAEGKQSLLWALDRLMLSTDFITFFLASKREIVATLGLDEFLRRLEPALMGGRDYETRVPAFNDSIRIAQEIGFPCFAAFLYVLLADVEFLLGQVQSAREHLREAQKLRSILFAPRSEELQAQFAAVAQDFSGNIAMEQEHRHIYEKGLEALRIVQLTVARIDAASGVADAGDAAGDLSQILAHVESVPAEEVGPIVQTLRDAGRLDDALQVLDHVEKAQGERISEETRGGLLLTRATVQAAQGNLPEALESMTAAEPLLAENRRWVARMNLAAYADAAGVHDGALKILDTVDIDRVARSAVDRFKYDALRANVLAGAGRSAEAFDAASRAIASSESLRAGLKDVDLRASWAVKDETARTYALALQLAVDLGRTPAAFDLSESSRSRLFIDEMAMGRGLMDEEATRIGEQIRAFEQRRDLLASIAEEDGQQSVRRDLLARLKKLDPSLELIRTDKKGNESLDIEELNRRRAQTDFTLEELEEKSTEHRVRTATHLFGDVVGFDGSRKLLADVGHAVLVEFIPRANDVLAFVVRPDSAEPAVAHVLEDVDVQQWSRQLIQQLSDPESSSIAITPERSPLAELLSLIEHEIPEGDVICFAPYGALHRVPFHALHLSAGQLIERNPVVYSPSASVLARVVRREAAAKSHGAIIVGNTRGDLPYAQREAEAVGRLLQQKPLAFGEATRSGLRDKLAATKQLRILHLACHGYFDGEDPLASGILATDDTEKGQPAVLSARDFLQVDFHPDLVALSACESGLSEVTPGDELMGLNRSLLIAGARSVLSSSWRVNDVSTSLLMRFFYDAWLTQGHSKAQALQAAQLRLMKLKRSELDDSDAADSSAGTRDLGGPAAPRARVVKPDDRVFAAPAHWAAFSLVGDWRH